MAGRVIKNTVQTDYKATGANKVVKDTDRIGKAQTRLGQASASAGRSFSAQANGLGGVVGVYAAAAANVFALTAAFTALNRAAQFETILRGTENLAQSVGSSSKEVVSGLKAITNGQLSIVEAATQANLALSAGFNPKQINELGEVALKASRALGRNLTDSFQRVTRGAIKLEPELLDEIGIFTRIEPAVNAYALQIGKSANQLTNFERRQAFVNQVIKDGQLAFAAIDTSVKTTQETFESLVSNFADLAITVGGVIADALAPFASFLDKNLGNRLVLLGGIALLVFGRLKDSLVSSLGAGLDFASQKLSNFSDKLSASKIDADGLTKAYKAAAKEFQGGGAFLGAGRAEGAELKRQLAGGVLTTQQAQNAQESINRLRKNEVNEVRTLRKNLKSNAISQAEYAEGVRQSNIRTKALKSSLIAVNAQLASSSKLGKALASALSFASVAALNIAKNLNRVFFWVNVIVSAFASLQFILSFFDFDLFTFIRDIIADIGKESRRTAEGFKALGEVAKTNDGIFNQLRSETNLTSEEFATVLPDAISQSENSLATINDRIRLVQKQIERISSNKEFSNFFEGIFTEAGKAEKLEELRIQLEKLQLAAKLVGNDIKPLANLIGTLAEKNEKAATSFAEGVDRQNLYIESQNRAVIALNGVEVAIGKVQGNTVVLDDKVEKLADKLVDGKNKFDALIESLSRGATNADKAGKELGILRSQLVAAREEALKLGRIEAVTAISAFLGDSVKNADELVTRLTNIDNLNKQIAKTVKTGTIDSAVSSGLIGATGELATSQEALVTNQANLLQLSRERLNNLKLLSKEGKLDLERQQEIVELQALIATGENASKARILGNVIATAERLKTLEKITEQLERQQKLQQNNLDFAILQTSNAIQENAEKLRIASTEEQQVKNLENQQRIQKQLQESIEQQLAFEKELLQVANERASIQAKIELSQRNIEDTLAGGRDQAAVREAERNIERAETFRVVSEKELINLRLQLVEKQTQAELNRIERAENLVIFERDQRLAELDRREQLLVQEYEQNFTNYQQQTDALELERKLFEANKTLEDAKRQAERTATENRIAEAELQAKNQKDAIDAAIASQIAEKAIQIEKAKLLQLQIEADNANLKGQTQWLQDYAKVVEAATGRSVDVRDPIQFVSDTAGKIIKELEDQQTIIKNTGEIQKNIIDANSRKTIDNLSTQLGILEIQQSAADAAANTTRQIFDQRQTALDSELIQDSEVIGRKLQNLDLEKQAVREAALEKLTALGIDRQIAIEALEFAREKARFEASEQARIRDAIKASRDIVQSYVEDGLMAMNKAFIEGNLTFRSVADGFREMLRNMLKDIQAAVFQKTIAKPIADGVADFLPKILGFSAGGMAHLAAGGSLKRDRVAAMLEPGEFVIRKEAAKKLGMSKLQELNSGTSDDPIAALIATYMGSKVKRSSNGGPVTGGNVAALMEYFVRNRGKTRNYEFESQRLLGIAQTMDAFERDGLNSGDIKGAGDVRNLIGNSQNSISNRGLSDTQSSTSNLGLSDEERRRREGTTSTNQAQPTVTPDSLTQFGLGSRGMGIPLPGMGLLGLLGVDVPRIGARAPRALQDGERLYFEQVADQLEEIYGVRPTRYVGNELGDIDPVTRGMFGRGGSAMTNIGGGVFGTRTAQGTPSFNSFQSGINAITSAFSQGMFRSTPLSLAEYNAASPLARARFNPGAYAAFGGGPALTKDQTAQLGMYGGYKNLGVGTGYTIPDGRFSGTIQDISTSGGNEFNFAGGGNDNFGIDDVSGGGGNFSGFGGDPLLAAGGLVRLMAGGGSVMARDRVPALLEPGEFVIRRPMAKAIGGPALNQMNATGVAPNIAVNVNNQGVPKDVAVSPPKMNGDKVILDIITRDMRNNGAIKKSLRGNR